MKNSLSYQTFLLAFAKSLDVFTLTVLGMILSRVLSMEDYGTYRQVWLLYFSFIPLFTLGITTSINFFVPRFEPERQKTFIFQSYISLFILGLLFAIFLYFGAVFFGAKFNNPALAQVIKIFALVPLLTMPTSYYHNLYICLKKAVIAAGILTCATLARFSVICLTIYVAPSLENIFKMLLVYYVLEFISLSFLIFRPFFSVPLKLGHQNLLEQMRFTVPIGLSSLVGTFNKQIDKLVISGYFSAREFAIYANGATELPIARVLNAAVMSVLMPELVVLYRKGKLKQLLELWHRSICKVSLIILPIMVFLFIFSRECLLLLYSQKYLESNGIFQIYLLTLPPRVTTFGSVLLAAGLSNVIMIYSVYTVFISVTLNILLIWLFGVWGAALATVLGIYFMVFIQLRKICDVLQCTYKQVYPWSLTLKIFLVSVAAGLLPWLCKPFFSNWIISFMVNGIVFSLLYLFLAVKTNLISAGEVRGIKRKVGKKLGRLPGGETLLYALIYVWLAFIVIVFASVHFILIVRMRLLALPVVQKIKEKVRMRLACLRRPR